MRFAFGLLGARLLTREEDAVAPALRRQGWSISALARRAAQDFAVA